MSIIQVTVTETSKSHPFTDGPGEFLILQNPITYNFVLCVLSFVVVIVVVGSLQGIDSI